MTKVKIRDGQQLENPEGGVYSAGESLDLGEDEARAAVRMGVAEDVDGVFADEDWAKAQSAAAEATAEEDELAAAAAAQVAAQADDAAVAEEAVSTAKSGGGSSRSSGRSSAKS